MITTVPAICVLTTPILKKRIWNTKFIENDVKWLGFNWSGAIRHSSDYFEMLFGFAMELIQKGLAYVDESTPEQIKNMRGTLKEPGVNSPYRDRSVEGECKTVSGYA